MTEFVKMILTYENQEIRLSYGTSVEIKRGNPFSLANRSSNKPAQVMFHIDKK